MCTGIATGEVAVDVAHILTLPSENKDESLSVLMPVRNGEATLEAALTDLAAGLKEHDELLVINDGSSDQTPEILELLSEQIPQLRVETTDGVGLVEALNLGIREATWPWIARADADDRYPAARLPVQRTARAPGVAAVTGDYQVVGPARSTVIPSALGSPFVGLSLLHPQRFPHPGVVFHRDAVVEAGGYRAEDFPAEDLGLWMRMTKVGDLVGVPQIVVEWTMSASSITHSKQAAQRAMTALMVSEFVYPQARLITAGVVAAEVDRHRDVPWGEQRLVLLARDLWAGRRLGVRMSAVGEAVKSLAGGGLGSLRAARGLRADAEVRGAFREEMEH